MAKVNLKSIYSSADKFTILQLLEEFVNKVDAIDFPSDEEMSDVQSRVSTLEGKVETIETETLPNFENRLGIVEGKVEDIEPKVALIPAYKHSVRLNCADVGSTTSLGYIFFEFNTTDDTTYTTEQALYAYLSVHGVEFLANGIYNTSNTVVKIAFVSGFFMLFYADGNNHPVKLLDIVDNVHAL